MIVTTKQEQQAVASAARKVGGYAELVRLSQELEQAGGKGKVVRDPNGKWRIQT
jgi:hypothetical protein